MYQKPSKAKYSTCKQEWWILKPSIREVSNYSQRDFFKKKCNERTIMIFVWTEKYLGYTGKTWAATESREDHHGFWAIGIHCLKQLQLEKPRGSEACCSSSPDGWLVHCLMVRTMSAEGKLLSDAALLTQLSDALGACQISNFINCPRVAFEIFNLSPV